MTRDQLRHAINNACDIMRREGLTTIDYMEQLSWLLFLKSFEETDASAGLVLSEAEGLSTGNNLEAEGTQSTVAFCSLLC